MKTAIAYARKTPDQGYTPVSKTLRGKTYTTYVRLEIVSTDLLDALDKATPKRCEVVLNTFEIEAS